MAERTDENSEKIKTLQQQVEVLSKLMQQQAYEIQRLREYDQHEREKLELRLENQRLRAERGLPPPKTEDEKEEADSPHD